MKIHQLSLFLENQPGQMIEPCRLLAGAGIDIRTLSLADTRAIRHPAPDRVGLAERRGAAARTRDTWST